MPPLFIDRTPLLSLFANLEAGIALKIPRLKCRFLPLSGANINPVEKKEPSISRNVSAKLKQDAIIDNQHLWKSLSGYLSTASSAASISLDPKTGKYGSTIVLPHERDHFDTN
eukprot:Gb_06126 [translate_table: standard]